MSLVPPSASRSPGLDVARSMAILGVLLAHATLFFEPLGFDISRTLPLHIWGGLFGVELFFALSGLLIGQILFRAVLPSATWHSVGTFLLRRWLRTLPAYYTILGLLVLVGVLQGRLPENIWKYAVFLQNSPPEFASFFPVSWSLSIEQWAYIWIPFLLLSGSAVAFGLQARLACHWTRERIWLVMLAGGIVLSCIVRFWLAWDVPAHWDNDFRKQVPVRMDAILWGVLIAWIKLYAPSLFARLSRGWCFALCILCLMWLVQRYDLSLFHTQGNVFLKAPAFTLVDMCCATLLCFLDSNPGVRRLFAPETLPGRLAFYGSCYAYSLYLVHLSFFSLFVGLWAQWGSPTYLTATLGLAMALSLSVGGAVLLYHGVEKPCMNMRRQITFRRNN